jgi:hypothetical protein
LPKVQIQSKVNELSSWSSKDIVRKGVAAPLVGKISQIPFKRKTRKGPLLDIKVPPEGESGNDSQVA